MVLVPEYWGEHGRKRAFPSGLSCFVMLLCPLGFPRGRTLLLNRAPASFPSAPASPPSASECCTRIFIAYFELS